MASELASPKKNSKPDEWEIRNWADKIVEAHEIMCDPDKMKLVKKYLKTKKKAMRSIDDLISYRNSKAMGDDGDDE